MKWNQRKELKRTSNATFWLALQLHSTLNFLVPWKLKTCHTFEELPEEFELNQKQAFMAFLLTFSRLLFSSKRQRYFERDLWSISMVAPAEEGNDFGIKWKICQISVIQDPVGPTTLIKIKDQFKSIIQMWVPICKMLQTRQKTNLSWDQQPQELEARLRLPKQTKLLWPQIRDQVHLQVCHQLHHLLI